MKKKIITVICTAILLSITACNNGVSENVKTSQYTESSDSNYSSVDALPYRDILKQDLVDIVNKIGVNEISDSNFENYSISNDGDIDVDFIFITDLKTLRVKCLYMKLIESWSIISVTNNESNLYYYVTPGAAGTVDIYDYATDMLLTKEDIDPQSKDELTDFSRDLDNMEESYNAALESIADKYGVKK